MKIDDVAAEDINNMLADIIDTVLKTVELTNEQEDELWDCIQPGLEKFFGYPNFRSYN
jgi:hypothetical protein